MSSFLKPVNGYVLGELVKKEIENKTKGGIILPDKKDPEPVEIKIISVEEGSKFKEGDNAIFKKYQETKVTYAGNKYIFVKEEDILALVK